MNVKVFSFEKFHNRKNVGSTRIRVRNLMKYWPELTEYKYGQMADVMIFQKVYVTGETYRSSRFDFIKHVDAVKILDTCDPDWLGANGVTNGCLIKETVDNVDAVVTSTEELAKFIRQLTDKPVVVIRDRFLVDDAQAPKQHVGKVTKAVWFGYSHNAELLRGAMHALERRGIALTVLSDKDPQPDRWTLDPEAYKEKYTFKTYAEETFYENMRKHDVCILPSGGRPQDRFKSNNKTVKSWLAGIPVVTTDDELEEMNDPTARNREALTRWTEAKKDYDARKSVEEYKALIDSIFEHKLKESQYIRESRGVPSSDGGSVT